MVYQGVVTWVVPNGGRFEVYPVEGEAEPVDLPLQRFTRRPEDYGNIVTSLIG